MSTTRYAQDSAARPCCPVCLAHGVVTLTADPRLSDDVREVDDGCTQPLIGVPCAECAAQTGCAARLTISRDPNNHGAWTWTLDMIDADPSLILATTGTADTQDDAEQAGLNCAHEMGMAQISGSVGDGIVLAATA